MDIDVKKILEEYGLTQHELADFTSIPRGRIQKWIEKKTSPPKADDAAKIALCATYFSTLDKEKVKSLVKTHRIFMGNVVTIAEYNELMQSGHVSEPGDNYKPLDKTGTQIAANQGHNSPTKTDDLMLTEMFTIMKQQNANVDKIAGALDKFANANESMARSIEMLLNRDQQQPPKAQAG